MKTSRDIDWELDMEEMLLFSLSTSINKVKKNYLAQEIQPRRKRNRKLGLGWMVKALCAISTRKEIHFLPGMPTLRKKNSFLFPFGRIQKRPLFVFIRLWFVKFTRVHALTYSLNYPFNLSEKQGLMLRFLKSFIQIFAVIIFSIIGLSRYRRYTIYDKELIVP